MALFRNTPDSPNSRHLPSRFASTPQTRQHSPSRVARTRQTCRHSPSRVARTRQTRKRQVWRVLREFGKFGKSGKFGECRLDCFKTYKICYLCLKRPFLSCAFAPQHSSRGLGSTRQTCQHLPSRVARTRQTRDICRAILRGLARLADTRQRPFLRKM